MSTGEVLSDHKPRKRGRRNRYPWDGWLDGKTRRLRQGTKDEVEKGKREFSCSPQSITDQLRRQAKKRGLEVSVEQYPDGSADCSTPHVILSITAKAKRGRRKLKTPRKR